LYLIILQKRGCVYFIPGKICGLTKLAQSDTMNYLYREVAIMKRQIARISIGVVGAAALILGLVQGGYTDTLQKAIRICLECIGIG